VLPREVVAAEEGIAFVDCFPEDIEVLSLLASLGRRESGGTEERRRREEQEGFQTTLTLMS
jgi:hypothetical protein